MNNNKNLEKFDMESPVVREYLSKIKQLSDEVQAGKDTLADKQTAMLKKFKKLCDQMFTISLEPAEWQFVMMAIDSAVGIERMVYANQPGNESEGLSAQLQKINPLYEIIEKKFKLSELLPYRLGDFRIAMQEDSWYDRKCDEISKQITREYISAGKLFCDPTDGIIKEPVKTESEKK
jgi:hypothetical protein